jgi:hypothetical protein
MNLYPKDAVMTPLKPTQNAFMERIILSLLPYFAATLSDGQDVRDTIICALSGYAARTRAEILEAAQILAYSFTALDSLAEAASEDVSLPMRLRLRGQTNALNRSKKQCQTALADSLCMDAVESAPLHLEPAPIGTAVIQSAPEVPVVQPKTAPLAPAEDQRVAAPTALPAAAPIPPRVATASMSQGAGSMRLPGASIAAILHGAAGVRMPHRIAGTSAPSANPLTQIQKNNAIWASVMGQVINDLQPNGRPAT